MAIFRHIQEPEPNRSACYFEVNNNTTPITTKTKKPGRWLLKKALGYGELWRQQKSPYPFVVRIATTTPDHKEFLREKLGQWLADAKAAGVEYPDNLWWFCDRSQYTVKQAVSVYDRIWQTATDDERHSLLDRIDIPLPA